MKSQWRLGLWCSGVVAHSQALSAETSRANVNRGPPTLDPIRSVSSRWFQFRKSTETGEYTGDGAVQLPRSYMAMDDGEWGRLPSSWTPLSPSSGCRVTVQRALSLSPLDILTCPVDVAQRAWQVKAHRPMTVKSIIVQSLPRNSPTRTLNVKRKPVE